MADQQIPEPLREEIENIMRGFTANPPFPTNQELIEAMMEATEGNPAMIVAGPMILQLIHEWRQVAMKAVAIYAMLGIKIDLSPPELTGFMKKLQDTEGGPK